jgi:hypothetical protein
MALSIPTEPSVLSPERPPPGYRIKLVTFNDRRKLITPRLQLAHTNAAASAGSIESSWNWSQRNTWDGYIYGNPAGSKYTTIPHFQVDLDGDAAMLLELNRQGIVNARANPFSIGYETADRGWRTDPYPTGSYFTEPQLQKMANGFAYCSMLFKIRLEYPTTWDGNGSACHTEPFSYPYWTSFEGKTCPGNRKKTQVRDVILPHARKIVAAWTGTTPAPTPTPTPPLPPKPPSSWKGRKMLVVRYGGSSTSGWTGLYSFDGGLTSRGIGSPAHAATVVALGALDARTRQPITDVSQASWYSTLAQAEAALTPYG